MNHENENHNRMERLRTLFFSMLYISACTFGGGFVIVTLMKRKFADQLHWLTEEEMLDMTALAQSSPGAIAVNAAILVGWKVEKAAGMAAAVLGTILPPMLILSVVSVCYSFFATNLYVAFVLKGMQAGVAAVILDVVWGLGHEILMTRSVFSILLMAAAFAAGFVWKINVILIILLAAIVGIVRSIAGLGKAVRS